MKDKNQKIKQYTKKQICEALAYWQTILNESKTNDGFTALCAMASSILPKDAALAKKAVTSKLSEGELNEGTASGVLMGVMGTLLALSMMGKISLNMKDTLCGIASNNHDAKLVQSCEKSIDNITAALNEIEDNISAIRSTHNLDDTDPSLDQLLASTRQNIDAAEREKIFKEIMAKD